MLALGANVWNMAIVEAYAGYAVYRLLNQRSELLALIAAGWVGITLAALSASLQLGLSPAFDYEVVTVVSVMVGGRALLGLGEGILTLVGVRLLKMTDIDSDVVPEVVRA